MTATHLVRAKIVGHQAIQTFGELYADPLYLALREHGYGDITGGNGEYDESGTVLQWLSIDIRLVDLGLALDFTRRTLQKLGAPPGSELEYTVKGEVHTLPISDLQAV